MTAIDSILERAVQWKVRMMSGQAGRDEQDACLAWRRACADHEDAWQKVESGLADCLGELKSVVRRDPAQARAVREILSVASPARRHVILALFGLGAATGVGLLAMRREWPLDTLLASHATATGERRAIALADGSRLLLDARSAVDVDMSAARRTMTLIRGRMHVSVAADSRPFIIDAPFCRLSVEAGRQAGVMAARQDDRTLAVCTEQSVTLRPDAASARTLQAGEGFWLDASGVVPLVPSRARAATAWERGVIEALDEPLSDVVEQLRQYQRGFIRLSSRAAQLRVQGVWPIDDVDATLDILARRLALRVVRYGGWLVTIDLASAQESN